MNIFIYTLLLSAMANIVAGFCFDYRKKQHTRMRRLAPLRLSKGEDNLAGNKKLKTINDATQNNAKGSVETNLSSAISPNERNSMAKQAQEYKNENDRAGALRRLFESFGDFGKPNSTMPVGSTVVVSGLSLPNLGLYEWQSYELLSVYDQGIDDNGMLVKIPRQDLKEDKPIPYGYTRYAKLFSERYHTESGPVLVSSDEIELVSVRDEVIDSLLMAFPVLGFWTALAFSFANLYNERYGGNFIDALFRT